MAHLFSIRPLPMLIHALTLNNLYYSFHLVTLEGLNIYYTISHECFVPVLPTLPCQVHH